MSTNDPNQRRRKRGEEENQRQDAAPSRFEGGRRSSESDSEQEQEADPTYEPTEPAGEMKDDSAPKALSPSLRGSPESIFDVLLRRRIKVISVVEDWRQDYITSREDGIRDLMQFFIESAGCESQITPEMQRSTDLSELILSLSEELSSGSGEYPLAMSGTRWKRFRQRFCDFVHQWVESCQCCIIHDSYMMDKIITLLIGLSISQVRAFRHTATLAAMKLMTALVDVALNLSADDESTRPRELDSGERNENIRKMTSRLFEYVFVHRYRDVHPEIRRICIIEIGTWMRKLPRQFLKDSNLKYIGWTLCDEVGDVRLRCLQALLPLYADQNLCKGMDLFTNKFKDIIVNLALGKESDVSVHAIKLLICIHRSKSQLLTDKDYELIYELVFLPNQTTARAAGEFLNASLFLPDEETAIVTRRGKKMSRYTSALKDLVLFSIESEVQELGAYLVDSLIDTSPMIKDWECYTDLLLEEPEDPKDTLDDKQVSALIEIMVHAVKQSATGEPPVERRNSTRQVTRSEITKAQNEQTRLTEHFIRIIPDILVKYVADVDKLTKLLELPKYFDLKIYTASDHDGSLDRLLGVMHRIVERHTHDEVLRACSETYDALCTRSSAIQPNCKSSRSTLSDKLRQGYDRMLSNFRELSKDAMDDTISGDIVIGITTALKKLVLFHDFDNLGALNIWNLLWEPWIKDYSDGQTCLPVEGVRVAISACESSLLSETMDFEECVGLDDTDLTKISSLRERIHEFMACLSTLLVNSPLSLQEDVFLRICDMLVMYSHKFNVMLGSESICYEPSDAMIGDLERFVEERVFVVDTPVASDGHRQIEMEIFNKRREFLAAYCKLGIHNVIGIPQLKPVLRHYLRFYDEYADIIKETLEKARENDAEVCAITVIETLFLRFEELGRDRNNRIERRSVEFADLKEMAKRFAMTFGLGNVKIREAIVALHRHGIRLAANPPAEESNEVTLPPNSAFIEVLLEFVRNLVKRDKMIVRAYFDRTIPVRSPISNFDEWEPHRLYRDALLDVVEVPPVDGAHEP